MCCHNLVFFKSPVNPVTLYNKHNSAFTRGLKALPKGQQKDNIKPLFQTPQKRCGCYYIEVLFPYININDGKRCIERIFTG